MSDGTGRQAMAAQSGTPDNPKSSNQESSKKPKTLGKYLLVSATQTIVEFGSFTLLHVLSVPSAIANGVAIGGSMYPLGASYDGAGVNFALFSQVAQKVELCLFDEEDNETRIEMTEQNSYVWHNYNTQHAAIYIGNGMVINALNPAQGTQVTSLAVFSGGYAIRRVL